MFSVAVIDGIALIRALKLLSITRALSRITAANWSHCGCCAGVIFRLVCRSVIRCATPRDLSCPLEGSVLTDGATAGSLLPSAGPAMAAKALNPTIAIVAIAVRRKSLAMDLLLD